MAKVSSRTRQVGDQIHRELAQLLQFALKDPRLGMVTVTAVTVSPELDVAQVYITAMNQQDEKVLIKTLTNAGGFLRRELSGKLRLRTVPRLVFKYDHSLERGNYMSSLIDQAIEQDKKNSSN